MRDLPQLRSLRELLDATAPFAREDRVRSWFEVLSTGVLTVSSLACAAAAWSLPLRLAASGLSSLLLVRTFVLYHDFEHGAILRKSRTAKVLFTCFGALILGPPAIWNRLHNYHHSHNCQFVTSGVGSFPVMTVSDYRSASPSARLFYRFIRSPLSIATAYLSIFLLAFCAKSFYDGPEQHRDSLAAIVVHFFLIAAYAYFGWMTLLLGFLGPLVCAHAMGTYLFYAQHNFPGVRLQRRTEWDYVYASIYSSSFLEGGRLERWFTANIGYHHVHHLNSRIPFYRLPEAMAAVPELQLVTRTSLRPRDIVACLRLKLWDTERNCMVPFPSVGEVA
jgi:omega-6 fatty acid desaturase (delta-12 desaturase)